MAALVGPKEQTLSPERQLLLRRMEQINAEAGVVYDPTVTHETLRQKMRHLMQEMGVTPEDNVGSRELMRMRYGENWDEE